VGFNVETLTPLRGVTFTVWDIGGQKKIRDLWRYYFQNTDGLIFVVDSVDTSRLEEAREELMSMLNDDSMRCVPVVVIANKQDLPNALTVADIINKLNLNDFPHSNKWFVQGACAVTGDGIWESIKQLADMIKATNKTSFNFQ
jgi:ADP-ribosylation factor protein 1